MGDLINLRSEVTFVFDHCVGEGSSFLISTGADSIRYYSSDLGGFSIYSSPDDRLKAFCDYHGMQEYTVVKKENVSTFGENWTVVAYINIELGA